MNFRFMKEPEEDTALLEILADAAHLGDPCPSTGTLARTLGISNTAVQFSFHRLREADLIDWRVGWCGELQGKLRVVTILGTGESTRDPQPTPCRARPADAELEQAKTRLRARGHIVFNAELTDGARGRNLVRVDHRRLSRQAVLALAGRPAAEAAP